MANEEKKSTEIYANGFYIGLRSADGQLYLSANGKEVAIINMSLITLKHLASKLVSEIQHYEQTLGVEIASAEAIQAKIDEYNLRLEEQKKNKS